VVISEMLVGNQDAISGLVIGFSGPLDPAAAQNVDNYSFVGTRNGGRSQNVALSGALYNDATNTVTLTGRELFSLRFFKRLRVTVQGDKPGDVADPSGNLLDGNRDGEAGGKSKTQFKVERGRKFSYQDADRDRVKLVVRGAEGRRPLYALTGPGGIVHEIWIDGRNNTLAGNIKARRNSDGITNLGRIVLQHPTNTTNLPSTFAVGQIVTDGQSPVDPLIRTL
jgi:hypothetical protein